MERLNIILFTNHNLDVSNKFSRTVITKSIEEINTYKFADTDIVFVVGKEGTDLELSYVTITKLWDFVSNGGTLFGESIDCMNFPASRLFGFQQDYPAVRRTSEKLKIDKEFIPELEGNLIEWGGYYQKGFSVYEQQWLMVGEYLETHEVKTESVGGTPAFIHQKLGRGKVVYASFSFIGAENVIPFRPQWVWSKVFAKIRETINIPLREFQTDAIKLGNRSIKEAINSSADWFMKSGILPKIDGSEGVYENIHSVTGNVRKDFRPDCHAHTALMFYLKYENTNESIWLERSKNIMQYLFDEGYQDMDEASPTYGFWKWFKSPAKYPEQIFTDDNAWVSFILLYLYKQTGNETYRKRGLLTSEALLQTQHSNGLRPIFLHGEKIREMGRDAATLDEDVSFNPHFESIAHATYIQAFTITGEKQYLDTAYRGTKLLLNNKTQLKFMYSETSGYSRLLFVLGQLIKYYEDSQLIDGLHDTIAYLKSAQHSSGGVEELDNPDPNRFGKEDTGVFRFNGEGIGDFLYTNNFLLINLWEVWKAIGDKQALDFYNELSEFSSKIQIKSEMDKYNGAWMRAFDLRKSEYFGNNGDIGWGPYCIEGGWTNALATTGLLLGQLDVSLFNEKIK